MQQIVQIGRSGPAWGLITETVEGKQVVIEYGFLGKRVSWPFRSKREARECVRTLAEDYGRA